MVRKIKFVVLPERAFSESEGADAENCVRMPWPSSSLRMRSFFVFLSILILLFMFPFMSVSAYSVYDGNMNSTIINYYRDVVSSVGFNDYVLFRSGEYEYNLVSGDLSYENNSFSGTECDVYNISYTSSGYTSSSYKYNVSTVDNFNLSVGNNLVYSNLGGYPDLMSEEGYYAKIKLIVICVIGISLFIGRIFGFVLRKR